MQPMVEGLEVLVGAVRDPELGAFVMVAPGGVRAELYGERAMAPAPCDAASADRLIVECRALDALLKGYRGGPPADRAGLVDTVTRVAALAAGLGPRLVALDLNPVIVGSRRRRRDGRGRADRARSVRSRDRARDRMFDVIAAGDSTRGEWMVPSRRTKRLPVWTARPIMGARIWRSDRLDRPEGREWPGNG